jgi:hypothetical protein
VVNLKLCALCHESLIVGEANMEAPCYVIFILNAIYFLLAFTCFTVIPYWTIRTFTPTVKGDVRLFAAVLRFLGGMNLAMAILAGLAVIIPFRFTPDQTGFLACVFALAHGSQFFFNVPVAFEETRARGKPVWPVFRGPMLYVFIGDGSMALANLVLSYSLLEHYQ